MIIETITHSGAPQISAFVGGYLETRTYYFASTVEALEMFLHEFQEKMSPDQVDEFNEKIAEMYGETEEE